MEFGSARGFEFFGPDLGQAAANMQQHALPRMRAAVNRRSGGCRQFVRGIRFASRCVGGATIAGSAAGSGVRSCCGAGVASIAAAAARCPRPAARAGSIPSRAPTEYLTTQESLSAFSPSPRYSGQFSL